MKLADYKRNRQANQALSDKLREGRYMETLDQYNARIFAESHDGYWQKTKGNKLLCPDCGGELRDTTRSADRYPPAVNVSCSACQFFGVRLVPDK